MIVAKNVKPFIPARLEVKTEDGSTFIETSRILREPDLQNRCLEKRELRRIMKILQERSAAAEPRRMRSGKPPGNAPPSSRRS